MLCYEIEKRSTNKTDTASDKADISLDFILNNNKNRKRIGMYVYKREIKIP